MRAAATGVPRSVLVLDLAFRGLYSRGVAQVPTIRIYHTAVGTPPGTTNLKKSLLRQRHQVDDDADAIDARRRLDRAMTSYVYVCTYDMPGKAYMWLQLFGRGMKRGFMICARILAKKKSYQRYLIGIPRGTVVL